MSDAASAAEPGLAPVPRVLSIAGTDPTGGAGVQADLKSIAAVCGYGMAAVTALVAQNTCGVRSVHRPPPDFLREQLVSVSDDVQIDAVKIGMLFDAEIIAVVREWLAAHRPPVVVLDPVMVATSGDHLLQPEAEDALRGLLPLVDLITPNVPELAALVSEPAAATWDALLDQARRLSRSAGVTVLAKGGHLYGDEVWDALVDPSGSVTELSSPRVETSATHGTGCSLSSAVATLRVTHGDWQPAVAEAKRWLTTALRAGEELHVGQGHGPVSHLAETWARAGTRLTPTRLAEHWWAQIADVRAEIDALPFVRALADGSLEDDDFSWYLAQDALYLGDYARVLAEASRRAPTVSEQTFWAGCAQQALVTELELHRGWLDGDQEPETLPGPVTTAYVDHLLATTARGGYAEVVAAALPCFWIYADVGARLAEHRTDDHPYAAWLTTYADEEFAEATARAVDLVSTLAASSPPQVRERMFAAFRASAALERDFFAAPLQRHDGSGPTVEG